MSDALLTDEQLMAYADGQFPADQVRQVEAAMARDPQVAARVKAFQATAQRLAALAAAQDATVPDALIARVRELAAAQGAAQIGARPADPVDLAAHRQARQVQVQTQAQATPRRPSWQIPLAASIALAIGLGVGFGLAPKEGPGGGAELAALDSAELHQALREIGSGQQQAMPDGGQVAIIASFTDGQGDLCREFEYDRPGRPTIVSVACHPGDAGAAWQTQFAVLSAPSDNDAYAPASSLETLDAYLGAIQAGQPLSEAEEAAALRQLP